MALGVGLALLLILLLALASAWTSRRTIARELLVGWLEARGVDAQVEFESLELDRLVARVRLGDPADPDLTVERVEADYAVTWPWSGGIGARPSRVRLVRPVLKARWDGQRLSLGALDPLIAEFTGRPPDPDAASPRVEIEQAEARLDTPYGGLGLTGEGVMENGRIVRFSARLPETDLDGAGVSARGLSGALTAAASGERLTLRLTARAERFAAHETRLSGAAAAIDAALPYPDMTLMRRGGAVALTWSAAAEGLALPGASARQAQLSGDFTGEGRGWIEAFALDGRTRARAGFAALEGEAVQAAAGEAAFSGRLTLEQEKGTPNLTVAGPLALRARRVESGTLALAATRADLELTATAGRAFTLTADGAVRAGEGRWPLFGPETDEDPPELIEMKRALDRFALHAPRLRLGVTAQGARVDLLHPARITPANGGALTVTAAGRPVFLAPGGEAAPGGAMNVRAERGRGLPEAVVAVPDWRLTPEGGFSARLNGQAALDFATARGAALTFDGTLAASPQVLTFTSRGCVPVTVERLDMDGNDVFDVSGRFCPQAAPLVTVRDGGWRATGRLEAVSASAPFLAMRFEQAQGTAAVFGGPSGLGLEARIDSARVVDATRPTRFHPVEARGRAGLADEAWSGAFDLLSDGRRLAGLTLRHDGRTAEGGLDVATETLVFAEGGLQPPHLSPLADDYAQPPVTGEARFEGRLRWTADAEAGTSDGRLTLRDLSFVSPAGPVKGVNGEIVFTNLVPLETAPDQRLTVDSLEAIAPLTGVEIGFALDKSALHVSGGSLALAGGRVGVEPFLIPLDPQNATEGVITLDRVQLGEIVAVSGFADKVSIDAVVSGRLPFSWRQDTGVRLAQGRLYAVQPGRLEIRREALTGLEAGGGGEGVPPNTVQDLAYQAMENLAFDQLDAEVNSLDQGRLGVLFHIRGRHDPPARQELRIGWLEFIRQEFLNRALPLPSDTGIDLTLDTTLNLDQLLADLAVLNRARAGNAESGKIEP